MGLLDEAIRQHLELKRQHGASDEELKMQEQEALGPVRREPVEPAATGPEPAAEGQLEEPELEAQFDEPAPEADAGYDEPAADLTAEPPEDLATEPPLDDTMDPYEEPLPADADALAAEAPTEMLDSEPELEDDLAGDTPARGFEAIEEPLEVENEPDEDEDEDVLEETPEFLQETPEHDRLWFEQKPPRDFDFDE